MDFPNIVHTENGGAEACGYGKFPNRRLREGQRPRFPHLPAPLVGHEAGYLTGHDQSI